MGRILEFCKKGFYSFNKLEISGLFKQELANQPPKLLIEPAQAEELTKKYGSAM
jgi:hypothetical protein